ncbi:type II secretion system F family protein [Glycomyces sp. TRM65418]|uniref:type II secretion system F family protein n=1 Tax=Glycomyces sp. TRM65418 TaxID=2867006 RepID=UPI001CE4D26A|nr:type II secretion system F family protein [Glycomyces sp. TRM65418]MCC3764738.1 type II secretion system F family protein [Glycomyces sp. TRM65418]QZD54395.1 type II secretion system F family protein [Glycomyces sp. TRM65418]
MNAIVLACIAHRPKAAGALAALVTASFAAWLAGHHRGLGPLSAITAAALAAVYTAAAVAAWHLALRRKRGREARRAAADTVAYLAADLAAGTDPARAVAAADPDWPAEATATARRLRAALKIAAELGAPAADLCRKLADHLREDDQCASRAQAQTASIRATAALLIALPAAGVALGEALGVDAVAFLLASPTGIAAAAAAMGLQAAGLAWTGALIQSVAAGSS